MRKLSTLILLLLTASCGINGTQKVEQDGNSFTYIVVRLEYLEQIKALCQDANPIEGFETETLHKKAIAECTIENMNVFNIDLGEVDSFTNEYCIEGADLSSFTPQQQADIIAACTALGVN